MMVKSILFFCILFCLTSTAQHTLTIYIKNCYKEKPDSTLKSVQLFYRDSTATYIKQGDYDPSGTACYFISDLQHGYYYLAYQNRYKNQKRIDFKIEPESDTTELILCPDRYNNGEPNHIPIIMQLKPGEFYTLKFETVGCEVVSEDSIHIERISDQYYLTHSHIKTELTIEEYEAIQRFEVNLNHFNRNGGCTNTDTYVLTFRNQTYTYVDESCVWPGGNELWKKLKLHKK